MMLLAVFAICGVTFSVDVAAIGNVAFSAAVSTNRQYAANEIVKYDNVLLNVGNAYDKDTGVFTAPKTGLYVFHVNGLSTPDFGFWFVLHHNYQPVFRAHGHPTPTYSSGGNTMALRVKSGERVYVKTLYASSVYGEGLSRYASFTGYLIAVETCQQ